MEGCFHAARSFYDECDKHPGCGCSNTPVAEIDEPQNPKQSNNLGQKDDSLVIDPKSTGRKRAAKMFPLDLTKPCEWQRKKFRLEKDDDELFVGCDKGLQKAIHHGPNKDTLVNEVGNVWRICIPCHNRYHVRIDPTYDWNRPAEDFFPIELQEASDEDIAKSEIYWINRKVVAGERAVNPND